MMRDWGIFYYFLITIVNVIVFFGIMFKEKEYGELFYGGFYSISLEMMFIFCLAFFVRIFLFGYTGLLGRLEIVV